MSDSTQRIQELAADAASQHLMSYTVSFLDREDGHRPASGVLVSLGNRLFIATNAHTISARPNQRIWLLTAEPRRAEDGLLTFVRSNRQSGQRPDVGYLELNPDTALPFLGHKEVCGIDRIECIGDTDRHRGVTVVGCPYEWIIPVSAPGFEGRRIRLMGYTSSTLLDDQLPISLPDHVPAYDPDIDVFVEYPERNEFTTDLRTGAPMELPHPSGMSGGGLWVWDDFGRDELFAPSRTRLFALQQSVVRDEDEERERLVQEGQVDTNRYIRAVHIAHWLRLIYEDYEDLRETLADRWPFLGQPIE